MDYSGLIKADLISIDKYFTSKDDMFGRITNKLNQKGYVKESFRDAITQREEKYPTGLETAILNVAIPHTDIEHVIKPFIYVLTLREPIEFIQMGTDDQKVAVDSVFFLGITEPEKQVGLLSIIMDRLQDEQFKKYFKMISSSKEMETFLKNNIRSEEK